jgi:glycosyltransferase involved in cell wall biosynthesis
MNAGHCGPSALVFAGLPPPIGGVASIVQMLHANLADRGEILFAAPLAKNGSGLAGALRALCNLARVGRSALKICRGGRVLMFSSAGFSFYEKLLWSACVQLLGRKPVLAMVDGNFPTFWQHQWLALKALARWRMAHSDMRLGVQSGTWADFYRGIFPQTDISVFAATVAPGFWQPAPAVQREPLRVLYVGWMIPEKGIVDLLDAFVHVVARLPGARLRLVGPLLDQQAHWARELARRQLADNVELVGPIADRDALMHELRSTALFVLPSHAEGLPVALLEAMALGVACIASDVGAIADVLDQGRVGSLVPVRAPAALAAEIVRLLSDPPARERLAAAAFARASTHYSTDAFVTSYLRLLDLP